MTSAARYFRIFFALVRFGLARELAFRGNFLIKMVVELLWLGILIVFYRTIFIHTNQVAGWSEAQYLFFVGCYFALEGLMETLFLGNCNEFADLVRSGDLDFYLLQPIDEQFLISCKNFDWSTLGNVILGTIVMGISLWQLNWRFDLGQALIALASFACGLAIAYSFLLMLTSTSIWFIRNQSLLELWWLFTSVMRYPREVFSGPWAAPLGWVFTFILPMLLVVNVPASVMVRAFEPKLVAFIALAAILSLIASRKFFRFSLRKYRSASS